MILKRNTKDKIIVFWISFGEDMIVAITAAILL